MGQQSAANKFEGLQTFTVRPLSELIKDIKFSPQDPKKIRKYHNPRASHASDTLFCLTTNCFQLFLETKVRWQNISRNNDFTLMNPKEFTLARLNFPDTPASTTHGVPATVPVTRPASVARYPRQDPRYVPDRVMQHAGLTNLSVQGNIHIHYDAQLRDVLCCTRLQLCFECREINMQRSYLYLRENSIESNIATKCCCCIVGTETAL